MRPSRHESGTQRRAIVRRVSASVLGLAVFAGAAALTWIAFQPTDSANRPSDAGTTPLAICGLNGVELTSSMVEATGDGVHIAVENRTGHVAMFRIVDPRDAQQSWALDLETQGVRDAVLPVPPGEKLVSCYNPLEVEEASPTASEGLVVTDPQGLWVDAELRCTSTVTENFLTEAPLSEDPRQVVDEYVPGLAPSDRVESAGYPKAALPVLRIVRNTESIAVIQTLVVRDNWQLEVTACSGAVLPTG